MDFRFITIAFAIYSTPSAAAQQDETLQQQEGQEPPEELLITGKRVMLRTQMLAAEKLAYEVFNKSNDEERFNISCSIYQPTGTRLERQVCQPNFVSDATAAHAQNYFENLRALLDPLTLDDSPQLAYQPVEAVVPGNSRNISARCSK
jgi:hypothetical protein